jgi:hypothetical protein
MSMNPSAFEDCGIQKANVNYRLNSTKVELAYGNLFALEISKVRGNPIAGVARIIYKTWEAAQYPVSVRLAYSRPNN